MRHHNKPRGTGITVRDGEHINQALRRFKRKVSDSKKLEEVRLREHYIKPTTARKKAKAAAKARWKKKLKDQALVKQPY